MTINYAPIVALVLAALACGQAPIASPTQDVSTPTPRPTGTSELSEPPGTLPPVNDPSPEPTRSRPPTVFFETGWLADKDLIAPGEPVTITLEIKNIWDKTVLFDEFLTTMMLTHLETRIEEAVPVEIESGEETPGPLESGESLTVVARVSPSLSAGLQPGRYRVKGFQFTYTRGEPGSGPTKTNMSSEALFVVIPPEGVVDRTVTVGQAREGSGALITLERIRFTPEQTTVSVFAASLPGSDVGPQPAVAGTSTPAPPVLPGSTPTPASVAAFPPWDGDLTELTAFYRVGGGTWRHVVDYSYRETSDGVHREWSFDPVSVNVKTLEFVIVPRSRPGRDGTFTYQGESASLSWEWDLPLQRPDLEYSMADLDAWYKALSKVIWRVTGVVWTDLNEVNNRIEIGMQSRRGAREEMEAAIASVDVPRGAVVIDVGCPGISPWPLDDGNPPDEAVLRAFEYSLDVADQASYGKSVWMTLTLRNVSEDPVSFYTGGRPPHDFVVSMPDGEQVWHWKCGKIIQQPLDSQTLGPGEEMGFVGEWEQVDNRGEPVPAGTYLVRGVLYMDYPEKLVTEAHELEIVR